jgi:hypothetical protein
MGFVAFLVLNNALFNFVQPSEHAEHANCQMGAVRTLVAYYGLQHGQ